MKARKLEELQTSNQNPQLAHLMAEVAKGAKLYDLRDSQPFVTAHIKGAENLPLDQLEAQLFPPLEFTTPIYLYCQAGVRSAKAALLLRQAGFEQVVDLGGWDQISYLNEHSSN